MLFFLSFSPFRSFVRSCYFIIVIISVHRLTSFTSYLQLAHSLCVLNLFYIYLHYIIVAVARVDNCYSLFCVFRVHNARSTLCALFTIWISFIEINLTRFKFEKILYNSHRQWIGNRSTDWLIDWLIDVRYEKQKRREKYSNIRFTHCDWH